MKTRQLSALALSAALVCGACGAQAADGVTDIVLADDQVTVEGKRASTDPHDAVYTGAEIVYYRDGTDESYGEGTQEEKHAAAEAAAHTVVTITRPGTYRLTGTLSKGQIAVDLGEEAEQDPSAVVNLILDQANVTCSVAPALIFYRVYECGSTGVQTAQAQVDTTAAGANVILAAGSENTFTGSHVARIYKEGTTKKLHKYDGAFYSKMSLNIGTEKGDNPGILNIVGDNEGLDSELHLTINGGVINISAQDDGINTNEDGVSVTTVNGGTLYINAGLGGEGDGIDSNGYLVCNGGEIWTMSNDRSPDGGIDADQPILLNGGRVSAFGVRNDAADSASRQPYMELSFASTLPAGSAVKLTDDDGNTVWSAQLQKACQSITLTTPDLALGTVYRLYVDGILQCWNGSGLGMGGPGGHRPEGGRPPEGELPPDAPDGVPSRPEGGFGEFDKGERPEPPEGFGPGQGGGRPGGFPGFAGEEADGSGSTDFTLTQSAKTFSGICDSDSAGKTRVRFTVDGLERSGRDTVIGRITAVTASVDGLDPALIQLTVTDVPSENYASSCLLSDGLEAVNALLPEDEGAYLLTVAVSGSQEYTGATQVSFIVGALPFLDLPEDGAVYEAVKLLYERGAMNGTGEGTFSPNGAVTRAQAVTVLGRLSGVQPVETNAFSDVAPGAWYAGYVGWAVEAGIVQGDGAGHFFPDEPVTAGQMAAMLSRYAQDYEDNTGFTGPLTRAQLAQMAAQAVK